MTSFKRLGQKSLQKFSWFFGRFGDTKRTFRNLLTFSQNDRFAHAKAQLISECYFGV